jgi:hypothetical protein
VAGRNILPGPFPQESSIFLLKKKNRFTGSCTFAACRADAAGQTEPAQKK